MERELRDIAMATLEARRSHGTGAVGRGDRFTAEAMTIRYMNPQTGIWKPADWRGALSISTTYTPSTAKPPYEDTLPGADGLARYKWRGTDPDHPDNRALREAMRANLPLIWFIGFAPGQYAAVYPVYLIGEEPAEHQFVVAAGPALGHDDLGQRDITTNWVWRETKQRLHQAPFRALVLDAYACRCAVCRFAHPPLLDAAHIIADSEGGAASVRNGLALCKMHHGAYDEGIIGITPNLVVEVNHAVLAEADGPMLRHGIQEFHGRGLMALPARRRDYPDPDALAARYERFRAG